MPLRTRSQLWAAWHADLVRRRRSPATIKAYRETIWAFWASLGRRGPLAATPHDLERFLNQSNKGSAARHGDWLTDVTRATYATRVTSFYRWAEFEGVTATNRMLRFIPPRRSEPEPRALELPAAVALFAHLATLEDLRLEVAVWLAYGAGLRVGEISRLRIEDVRLRSARPRIHVMGKGGRERTVALGPLPAEALAAWLAQRPRTGWVIPNHGPGRHHRPVTPAVLSKLLAQVMHDAGLQDTAHALRHTFATMLLAASHGTALRAVSRLLGHSSTVVTERTYTQSYDADAEDLVMLLPDPRPTSYLQRADAEEA